MKVIALTYNYDLDVLAKNGRFWAKDVYRGKDFILKYSAASYATFIDKNPDLDLHIYTDDIEGFKVEMLKYNIDQNRVIYVDYTERLKKYVDLDFSLRVTFEHIMENQSPDEYTVKIDNDMIFVDKLPIFKNDFDGVLVWKYEHYVATSNPLWGEKMACEVAIGDTEFKVYNMGLMGLPKGFPLKEAHETMNNLVAVDISDVTDLDTKTWHVCDQTAWNWIFHKYNYNVLETDIYVRHHFADKSICIEEAKYLLK